MEEMEEKAWKPSGKGKAMAEERRGMVSELWRITRDPEVVDGGRDGSIRV